MQDIKVVNIDNPFIDQKPGTSGLRKSVVKFEEDHYLEIFIESVLRSFSEVQGSTIILGGDGRYGNERAIKRIISICAAHKVGRIIVLSLIHI